MEKKITGLVNERFQDLRHQLASESKTRYDLLENLKTCLENDFPKLRNEIQLEIMQREQGDQEVQAKVDQELDQLNLQIEGERKARNDA